MQHGIIMLSIFDLVYQPTKPNVGWTSNCFLCNAGDRGKVIRRKLRIFKMICKGRVSVSNPPTQTE